MCCFDLAADAKLKVQEGAFNRAQQLQGPVNICDSFIAKFQTEISQVLQVT